MDIDVSPRRIKALPNAVRQPLLKLGLKLIPPFNRAVRRTRLGAVEFYPCDELPWVAELEAHWTEIRDELDAVLARLADVPDTHKAYAGQEFLSTDDKWKAFVFCRGAGEWEEDNCRRCPTTRRLLERVPGLEHAMFSILAPGKRLPAHHGPYAGLVDCHLGLRVPDDRDHCKLRVGDTTVSWDLGRMIVFDDTFEHEVWNDTPHHRAVLLMYVRRPLPLPLHVANLALMRFIERVL
ncbi:aspartyl/asparaginyl beta-hydroxylase domain-containing protein [Ideonella sp. DXS22W]|uniref:Aspartyl/asparaginyl beta-hydroxylase domain-containing protein n=1 Tax=Pseudaquabacterium inlustre TaxID=2984192 RepID=A0ABU9CJQ9_9BURK